MRIKNTNSLLLLLTVLVLAIAFETLQQQYYIRRFNLAQEVLFFELLTNQAYRWFVWIGLGFSLIPIIGFAKRQKFSFAKKCTFYAIGIVLLVLLNIALISLIAALQQNGNMSIYSFWADSLTFFTFQKAPIYTLGYIAVSVILDQELSKVELEVKIEALEEVKKTNQKLYKQLAENESDKAQVLHIKVGNKRKIIPVSSIIWIASDDYCVRVHTANQVFTMRSSLKQLEQKLGAPFIRIHRQAIVNMTAVTQYRADDQSAVLVNEHQWIPVSKKNLRRVKNYLKN